MIFILVIICSVVRAQDPFNLWNPMLANNLQFMQFTDMVIQRYFYPLETSHHYVVTNNTVPVPTTWPSVSRTNLMAMQPGLIREEDVGRVVSTINTTRMQQICQQPLVQVTRYERVPIDNSRLLPPVSYFSKTAPGSGWNPKETFYCSDTIGNCGANWQLTMFPMNNGTIQTTVDLFYPSNPGQLAVMQAGLAPWSRQGTVVCYIWK